MEYGTGDTLMRNALRTYFERNGFGADGGYGDTWVNVKIGPVPFPMPNTDARRRAVRYHDLHHILTDYQTDLRGEFEISAWEIAAGCKDYVAAWQLNLLGMLGGISLIPSRTFRAFIRGRRMRTFYGTSYDRLLDLTIAEARAETTRGASSFVATPADVASFGAAALASVATAVVCLPILVPLAAIAAPILNLAARRARATDRAPASSL